MKKILIVVSGGPRIEEALELKKQILSEGHQVKMIATNYVLQFYENTKEFEFELHQLRLDGQIKHVDLARWADLVIVVPASANTLAKYANGVADNFALAVLQVVTVPIFFCPVTDWNTFEFISKLGIASKIIELGNVILAPRYVQDYKNIEQKEEPHINAKDVFQKVKNYFSVSAATRKKILLVSGSQKSYIDPVHHISADENKFIAHFLENNLRLEGFAVEHMKIESETTEKFILNAKVVAFNYYIQVASFLPTKVEQLQNETLSTAKTIKLNSKINAVSELKKFQPKAKYIIFNYEADGVDIKQEIESEHADILVWCKPENLDENTTEAVIATKKSDEQFNGTKFQLAKTIIEKIK